jgi:hypothetical protein
MLSAIVTAFERHGWRDVDDAALKIVRRVEDTSGAVQPETLAEIPSPTFLARNGATRAELRETLSRALGGMELQRDRPLLIAIDEIDSFRAVSTIDPRDVAAIATPKLQIPEETVKEFIGTIIGEPYLPKDWGGELSDIDTTRVMLDGRRVAAAFLLKGPAAPNEL